MYDAKEIGDLIGTKTEKLIENFKNFYQEFQGRWLLEYPKYSVSEIFHICLMS